MADASGTWAVVTHGGAGNDEGVRDGCVSAAEAARAVLGAGGRPREAAVAATVVLEDDPRMNAGTGAVLRFDGATLQCDAAVMDATDFGGVCAVERVQNPIRLARAVMDLPHLLLAADGAEALADRLGLPRKDLVTDRAKERAAARQSERPALWAGADLDDIYRFALGTGTACDTVGAVVRGPDGTFAAAGSTGGLWCALRGRVGDTPIPGAGLYAGDAGAVAATGVGERIWRDMMSLRAYERMAAGESAQRACDAVVATVTEDGIDIGLIAVDATTTGIACTRRMPAATLVGGAPPGGAP